MLGSMISKIRKDKHITKVELSKRTGINIGHLTHIEKGERNPSHKTLRLICDALEVPYQSLALMYDKDLPKEHERCKMLSHISYNKVLAVDDYSKFIDCPKEISDSTIAVKVLDNSMEPQFKKDSYCFVALNSPLNNREIGLFEYNNKFIIRKFIIRKDSLVLRSNNDKYEDICLSEDDDFTIIGKIIN